LFRRLVLSRARRLRVRRPLVRGGVTQRYAAASALGLLETSRITSRHGPEA